MRKVSVLILIVLVVGIIVQVVYLWGVFVPDVVSIRSNLGRSSIWRGANFNQSGKVADFLVFLNQNIPENARVVLPTLGSDRKLLTTPYMQFFLAPREVINCQNVDCLQTVVGANTYIVIVGQLPESVTADHATLMFDENWGVLLPESHLATDQPSTVQDFNSVAEFLGRSVWPLLWLALLTLVGTITVVVGLPGNPKILQVSLGYGVGLGIFSLAMALVSLLGVPLTQEIVILTTIILLPIALIILWFGRRHIKVSNSSENRAIVKPKFDLIPFIFVGIGLLTVLLGVGKGYHWIDAIQIWGVKGYGIAVDGTIDQVTRWGTNTLGYPLHIPILIAAFSLLFGDILPASKMIFAGYYLALMLLLYAFLLEISVRRWLSGLAVLLLMLTPLIFRHATIGYANLPLSFYLVAGIGVFILAIESKFTKRNLFLSGIFFVCAAWTRSEGLNLALGAMLILTIVSITSKSSSFRRQEIIFFFLPVILYLVFWQITKAQIYPDPFRNSDLFSRAFNHLKQGDLHFEAIFYILAYFAQELLSLRIFGVVGLILLFSTLLVIVPRKNVPRTTWILITVGGMWVAMIVGMYYLLSFSSSHDLSWWVTSGFDRMVLPGLILLFLGVITAWQCVLPSKIVTETHN